MDTRAVGFSDRGSGLRFLSLDKERLGEVESLWGKRPHRLRHLS